jgi:hypothetical protein
VVESTALEMRRAFTGTVGSNPTLSANRQACQLDHIFQHLTRTDCAVRTQKLTREPVTPEARHVFRSEWLQQSETQTAGRLSGTLHFYRRKCCCGTLEEIII